jgi:uncharacterized protein (DUF488 family)
MSARTPAAWTIGHSTLPIDEFIARLAHHRIEALADVRRFPGSRKHPQFNADALAQSLQERSILYIALPELGGRRRARPDSRNVAWRNESFRGYADYMETGEFRAGLQRLVQLLKEKRTAIMCAEGLWWRCHRALISDVLKAEGVDVRHIMPDGATAEHPFTAAARVSDGRVFYGPGDDLLRDSGA